MKKLLFTFGFLLFANVLLSSNVRACSCGTEPPLYESFKNADAVFAGTVTKLEEIKIERDYEIEDLNQIFYFQVSEAFKGVSGKTLKVNAGIKDFGCYSGFDVGDSYLVFATEGGEFYHAGGCSRYSELKFAQAEIFFIRELLKGKPESQIYGSVSRNDNFPGTEETRITYLPKIPVIIENDKKRFQAMTDKNGVYRFDNIPEGEYNIKPIVPPIHGKINNESTTISITRNKKVRFLDPTGLPSEAASHFLEFGVRWDNQVSGKIYDAEGRAAKYVCAKLLPVALANKQKSLTNKDDFEIDCDDEFDDGYKTPGDYVLVIETFAPFGKKNKIRTFYPNALTIEKAQVFDLKADSKFNFDIILPRAQNVRNIAGEVVWSNGVSLKDDAWAKLFASEIADDEKDWKYDSESTDASGKFVLQGFENADYWLHVSTTVEVIVDGEEKRIEVAAKPIKIKAGEAVEPLKIVLQLPDGVTNLK